MKRQIERIILIRKMVMAIMAMVILIWAFPKNNLLGKMAIFPFLVCSIASFLANIFLLFEKKRMAHIFLYIFKIFFFIYYFGFLGYASYYAIVNKNYSLFIPVGIFIVFSIPFLRSTFFVKK